MYSFECPCGFRKDGVYVGATREGGYLVVLCRTCHRLFSVWTDGDPSSLTQSDHLSACRGCGKPALPITAPGAWGPPALQARYPDTEPWLVEEEEPVDIKILCPKCGEYSLSYALEAFWD
jgi:hypothetical protein